MLCIGLCLIAIAWQQMFHIQWALASPQSPCEMVDSCSAILQTAFNRGNQLQHKSPPSRCKWTPWKILMKTNVWCLLRPRDMPRTICSCSGLTLWQLQPIENTNAWPASGNKARLDCLNHQCLILQIKIAHSWQLDGSVIPLRNFSNGAGEKQHAADSLTFAKKICPCLCWFSPQWHQYGDECVMKTWGGGVAFCPWKRGIGRESYRPWSHLLSTSVLRERLWSDHWDKRTQRKKELNVSHWPN